MIYTMRNRCIRLLWCLCKNNLSFKINYWQARIISLRGKDWAHKTSNPFFFFFLLKCVCQTRNVIGHVYLLLCEECDWSCIFVIVWGMWLVMYICYCVRGITFASVSTIVRLDFRIVQTIWWLSFPFFKTLNIGIEII